MSEKEGLTEKEKEITPQITHPKKQPPRYAYEDKKQTHIKNEPKIGPAGILGKNTDNKERDRKAANGAIISILKTETFCFNRKS